MSQSSGELTAIRQLSDRDFAIFQSEANRRQRHVLVAYILLATVGFLGIHKVYFGSRTWGIYAILSFVVSVNLFGLIKGDPILDAPPSLWPAIICGFVLVLGLIVDLFTLPEQVEVANHRVQATILRQLS